MIKCILRVDDELKGEFMLTKVKYLKNYTLKCKDGELGKIKEVYFDDQNWDVRYFVVNTGVWLIGRTVLVSPLAVVSFDEEKEEIEVNLTKSQIENSPVLESDKPVSEQYQMEYNAYYSYPLFMGALTVGGALPYKPIHVKETKAFDRTDVIEEWDQHLRSSQVVHGYDAKSLNDSIGYVDDFIVDTTTWKMKYLIIDTKLILKGKKYLVSTLWINHISWHESIVFINLSGDEIEGSPDYSDDMIIDRTYETGLHDHYNQVYYWSQQ